MKKLLVLLMAMILMLGLALPASAASAKAAVMRLELAEGSVTVKDASGIIVAYSESMRLYSGYSVTTGDDSCAYISLDDSKAIKLDMNTSVSIKKSGRKLQVKLTAGQIVFNVTTPLAGDEALEIRTSTMVTGIRGSSGIVSLSSIQYVTGHGIVYVNDHDDPTLPPSIIFVQGGQFFEYMGGVIRTLGIEDIPSLYLKEVENNPELQNSIKEEGNYSIDELLNELPEALSEEADELASALNNIIIPDPAAENTDPAFQKDVAAPPPEGNDPPAPPVLPGQPELPGTQSFSVTFLDADGFTVLEKAEYPYGTAAADIKRPADPAKPSTPQYFYTFDGWDKEITDVTAAATYTAVFKETLRSYTITWNQDDGTTIGTTTVSYGTVPTHADPAKQATAEYSYTFAGWDPSPASVTGEATYTATYDNTANAYSVTWMNGETVFRTSTYDYGMEIGDPGIPEKTGCTFTGWDEEIPSTMPARDLTFNAQWTVKQYTVTFADEDGTVLKTAAYDYGTSAADIVLPADPAKAATAQYTYAFAGWGEIADVTADATYTASYSSTLNQYTVTFTDEDGTVLKTAAYPYGTAAADIVKPEEPSKAATPQYTYAFAGWSPAVGSVTKDVTYTAVFAQADREYTVTWLDDQGKEIDTTSVAYGKVPDHDDARKEPTVQYSYAFIGWEPALTAITADATYTATFKETVNLYTITWKQDDGSVIDTTSVAYGTVPSHADAEKRDTAQYTFGFAGWDPTPTAVTGDAAYTATYNTVAYSNQHTVTFKDEDGSVLKADAYDYGTAAADIVLPDAPSKPDGDHASYVFDGWSPDLSDVTEDAVYTATYREVLKTYTVTFVDDDGTVIKAAAEYVYGTAAADIVKPGDPTKDPVRDDTDAIIIKYSFSGWTPALTEVTGNAVYTAGYVPRYRVTFDMDGHDGTEPDDQYVENNSYAVQPDVPTDDGYEFAGWYSDPARTQEFSFETTPITSEITLYAKWRLLVTVTFFDWDGETVLSQKDYGVGTAGSDIEIPSDPTGNDSDRAAYVFNGWYNGSEVIDPEDVADDIDILTDSISYTADYVVTYDLAKMTSALNTWSEEGYMLNTWNDAQFENITSVKTGDHYTFAIQAGSEYGSTKSYGSYNLVIKVNGVALGEDSSAANYVSAAGGDEENYGIEFQLTVPNCRDHPDFEDGFEFEIECVYLLNIYQEADYGVDADRIWADGAADPDDVGFNYGPASFDDEAVVNYYVFAGSSVSFSMVGTALPDTDYKYLLDPYEGDNTFESFHGFHTIEDNELKHTGNCVITLVRLLNDPASSSEISTAASEAAEEGAALILTGAYSVDDISTIEPSVPYSGFPPTIFFTNQFTLTLNADLCFALDLSADEGTFDVYNAGTIINNGDYCFVKYYEDIFFFGFEEGLVADFSIIDE